MEKKACAILGSGNIGTDLLIKIIRQSEYLRVEALVGIDPDSEGLARARKLGVNTSSEGVQGLLEMPCFPELEIIFDATSAQAHIQNYEVLKDYPHLKVIDLTPAAIGPYVVPVVNLDQLRAEQNLNMVTCGGQATIPIVAAVAQQAEVYYSEIVASIASKSAGPGTRANIDEFTETTARAIERIGGAQKGKAIIILNPAEPPLVMRDTVFTLSELVDEEKVRSSIEAMIEKVKAYVPDYKLHQEVQFERITEDQPLQIEGQGPRFGLKTTVFLEVTGAGHYLPAYAGNLDIMTSAAIATAEMSVRATA